MIKHTYQYTDTLTLCHSKFIISNTLGLKKQMHESDKNETNTIKII